MLSMVVAGHPVSRKERETSAIRPNSLIYPLNLDASRLQKGIH